MEHSTVPTAPTPSIVIMDSMSDDGGTEEVRDLHKRSHTELSPAHAQRERAVKQRTDGSSELSDESNRGNPAQNPQDDSATPVIGTGPQNKAQVQRGQSERSSESESGSESMTDECESEQPQDSGSASVAPGPRDGDGPHIQNSRQFDSLESDSKSKPRCESHPESESQGGWQQQQQRKKKKGNKSAKERGHCLLVLDIEDVRPFRSLMFLDKVVTEIFPTAQDAKLTTRGAVLVTFETLVQMRVSLRTAGQTEKFAERFGPRARTVESDMFKRVAIIRFFRGCPDSDIEQGLAEKGMGVAKIERKGHPHAFTCTAIVTLTSEEHADQLIFGGSLQIGRRSFEVQKVKPRRPVQCYRCQSWRCSTAICRKADGDDTCRKCAGKHRSSNCTAGNTRHCALCGGAHASSSARCKFHPANLYKTNKKKHNPQNRERSQETQFITWSDVARVQPRQDNTKSPARSSGSALSPPVENEPTGRPISTRALINQTYGSAPPQLVLDQYQHGFEQRRAKRRRAEEQNQLAEPQKPPAVVEQQPRPAVVQIEQQPQPVAEEQNPQPTVAQESLPAVVRQPPQTAMQQSRSQASGPEAQSVQARPQRVQQVPNPNGDKRVMDILMGIINILLGQGTEGNKVIKHLVSQSSDLGLSADEVKVLLAGEDKIPKAGRPKGAKNKPKGSQNNKKKARKRKK